MKIGSNNITKISRLCSTEDTAPYELTGFRYKMGAVSDRHVGASNGSANFVKCLQTHYDNGCEFIIESGDMTMAAAVNGEWAEYQRVCNASPFAGRGLEGSVAIYECMGNHDNGASNDLQVNLERFKQYSCNGYRADASVGYYYLDLNGDRFIFTWIEEKSYTSKSSFSNAQLDWLEETINSYDGNGFIWVLSHQGIKWHGAGDWCDRSSPYYGGHMPVDDTSANFDRNRRFFNILCNNPKIFHVHGHSHFSYRYVEEEKSGAAEAGGTNPYLCAFSKPGNKGKQTRYSGCTGIHIPSGTRVRYADSYTAAPSTEHTIADISEGLDIEVFENGVRLTGLNDNTGHVYCVHEIIFNKRKTAKYIYKVHEDGTKEIIYPYTIPITPDIPAEYQKVEYLESTGTQYIDTSVGTLSLPGMEVLGKAESATSWDMLFGSYTPHLTLAGVHATDEAAVANMYVFRDGVIVVTEYQQNTKHLFRIQRTANGTDMYVDGTMVATNAQKSAPTKLGLFAALQSTGIPYSPTRCKSNMIWSAKVYDGETVVRFFIPCYRKSDHVAGMYDVVGNMFYTNAGTGTFNIGPELN